MYEPVNITARPVNGTASAAFSCAIRPSNDLVEIQWLFDAMPFGSGSGSGMGLRPAPPSGMLSNDMEGVTIHQPADSGTSILILDSISNDFEGFYSCVAVFPNKNISSSAAALVYDRMWLFNQYFLYLMHAEPVAFISHVSNSLSYKKLQFAFYILRTCSLFPTFSASVQCTLKS